MEVINGLKISRKTDSETLAYFVITNKKVAIDIFFFFFLNTSW